MYVHCFRSGHIELSDQPNIKGGICIGEGTEDELTRKLNRRARKSWDNKWLVPGVPEADTSGDALNATFEFKDRMKKPIDEG